MKTSRFLIIIPLVLAGCGPDDEADPVDASAANESSVEARTGFNGADTIEALSEAFEKAITNRDREALLALYHTENLDPASLDHLKSRCESELEIKETSESFTVTHVETLNYSRYGSSTDGVKLAYYPTKHLSGGLHLSHTHKERPGRGLGTYPVMNVDGSYYLAAPKIQDLPQDIERKFYNISMKDDQHEVFAPLFVTYSVGDHVQIRELPARRGMLGLTELLSISCPPIPTAGEATLVVVNARDEEDILLEIDFDPRSGFHWQNPRR